jgi:hypothetical protein
MGSDPPNQLTYKISFPYGENEWAGFINTKKSKVPISFRSPHASADLSVLFFPHFLMHLRGGYL